MRRGQSFLAKLKVSRIGPEIEVLFAHSLEMTHFAVRH